MLLTKEQMLRVAGRTFVTLAVPELDGEVRLASLAAGPGTLYNGLRARKDKGEDVDRLILLLLIEYSLVNENGDPLFDKPSAEVFLDKISGQTAMLLASSIPAPKGATVPPGNSEASPSVA